MAGKANKILNFDQGRSDQPSALTTPLSMGAIQTATLVQFDDRGQPLVDYAGGPGLLVARTIIPVTHRDCGREVLLAFEEGNGRQPVVVGFFQQPAPPTGPEAEALTLESVEVDHLVVDGQTVSISAQKEIVLQCGQASITLNRSGKVVIRGAKIVTHASGINKIKGAAVSIN